MSTNGTLLGHGVGSDIQRSMSFETLAAHPLLSPGPTSPSHPNSSPESSKVPPAPKYLPYTPRQRVTTGSATTGTTVHSSVSVSPQQHQGGATSKLQLQNLKAVAQNIGLDAGSLGWAMLEELVAGHDHGPPWHEIWGSIATGKATLLLPIIPANPHEVVTSDFFKDHVIFCNGPTRNNAPVVTLSGLRGNIDDDLVIKSTLSPTSKPFQALLSPATRSSTLLSLPPLPIPLSASTTYPTYTLPSFSASLPVPPRTSPLPKPPLPPRPGTRQPTSQASRLSNPFASLFSKSSAPPSPALPAPADLPLVDHVIEVSAFTINRPIIKRDVAKTFAKAVKTEIKESLAGVPSWVVDRVQSFSANLQTLSKSSKKYKEGNVLGQSLSEYTVAPSDEHPEDMARSFQSFYASLEDDLNTAGSPSTTRRRDDRQNDDERDRARREQEKVGTEARTREILEKVERTLCSVFYDRLFRQSNSDDASHDEALSSRVAALNMLDLGLEHLGVDVGHAGADVERVIAACGQTISQLEMSRCPADKSAILVAAHRIIVDGLSRLPPVRLTSNAALEDQKSPRALSFDKGDEKTPRASDFHPDVHADNDADLEQPSENPSPAPADVPLPPPTPEIVTSPTSIPESSEPDADTSTVLANSTAKDELPAPPQSPMLTISPPHTPTAVSGDILLPLIIFSVVKSNPAQLVSHLLYTERYRNQRVGGEESYCLINLMAVVEFLENVDLGALGLKESEKTVMSAADLTPIPLAHATDKSETSLGGPAGLRGRVEQQVDAITGSANKVILGVVDSSFGVLRALLPAHADQTTNSEGLSQSAPWNTARPGFGLLRRESGFSIASLAASLPGRERPKTLVSRHGDDGGQEMVESRPGSIRSVYLEEDESSSDRSERVEGSTDGEEVEHNDDDGAAPDAKSIRSFESMMSGKSRQRRDRMSLTDRLANMSRLTRGAQSSPPHDGQLHNGSPPSRRTSLLLQAPLSAPNRFDTPISSRSPSPTPEIKMRIPPPNRRFLECSADDIRISEVSELLLEYRRLVHSVRSMGGFED